MKVSGSNSVQIHAPADRCYAALLDFASYPAWFPGVRTAESVAAPDDAPTVRLVFSAGVAALPDVECVLRYEVEPARRCTPTVVGGDLRVDGPGWLLTAKAGDLTEVTYEVTVEMDVPGGFLAERAFRGPARRYLVEQPPERLRDHIEGGG
jgi:uncharacterized membrane protein